MLLEVGGVRNIAEIGDLVSSFSLIMFIRVIRGRGISHLIDSCAPGSVLGHGEIQLAGVLARCGERRITSDSLQRGLNLAFRTFPFA